MPESTTALAQPPESLAAIGETPFPEAPSESLAKGVEIEAVMARLTAPDPPPFAVLCRPHAGRDTVEVLFGELDSVPGLADLPEPGGTDLPVLAVVPFRQIRERGFEAIDDGAPLLALRTTERIRIRLSDLIERLPQGPQSFIETGFDVTDVEYELMVRSVLADEIAAGAGSNFVLHRCLTGRFDPTVEPPARAALGVLKRLLLGERQAYWTFVVHTPASTFVGATPERHVSLDAGIARMNPISGTLRYPAGGWADRRAHREGVLAFLADPKERDELAMVVDEELKMMARCTRPGDLGLQVRGPYLKEMARLAHTEYVIEGPTSLAPRQVLAATMFAPTVTGSPIRNACQVIARHERRGRRYYGGVLALIGRDAQGEPSLDSPILIRTAEIVADGSVRVAVGATLVRGSEPASELAETRSKSAGLMAALRPDRPRDRASVSGPVRPGAALQHPSIVDAEILAVLEARNRTLARFWLRKHDEDQEPADRRSGGRITVINAEDDFTGMLAHQLHRLGFAVDIHPWAALTEPGAAALVAAELVVLGPGPGDPNDLSDQRILALHRLAKARLAAALPVVGICLGHQILAIALGLRVDRLSRPDQGRQTGISLFGVSRRVGFYNSYVVRPPDRPSPGLEVSLDGDRQRVQALRGEMVAGVQFHPESVLTTAGLEILDTELSRLVTRASPHE